MQVIGHDDERVNTPGAAKRGLTKVFLKPIAVDVITYDVLTAVAPGHEVVDRARVLKAQASWHALPRIILAVGRQEINLILTPRTDIERLRHRLLLAARPRDVLAASDTLAQLLGLCLLDA